MIKLEIPVENDEDIMNMSLSRENVEHFLPQSSTDPIPDLILSATGQTRPRTYSGQSLGRETKAGISNQNKDTSTSLANIDAASNELNSCGSDVQTTMADQSVRSAIAKKRDSLRRSRQLHRTISDDSQAPMKRRIALERENELVESSLEDVQFLPASSEFSRNKDHICEEEFASIVVTTLDQPTLGAEANDVNDVEMQFLRTLQSGISRAIQSPMRARKFEPKNTDEETWC